MLACFSQIAEAMKYLHANNIIYRDLKPSNVLVWRFPEPLRQWENHLQVELKVADYGISKRNTPWGIKANKGTQAFQPPEGFMDFLATHKVCVCVDVCTYIPYMCVCVCTLKFRYIYALYCNCSLMCTLME